MVFSGDIRFKAGGQGVDLGRRDGDWLGSSSENQGATFRPSGSRGARDACRGRSTRRESPVSVRARK